MMTAATSDSKALIGAVMRSLCRCGSSAPMRPLGLGGMDDGNWAMGHAWIDMTVLLVPHVAVDVAALHQLVVGADVVNLALLHHQDGVRRDQHREAVRDADDGASLGDV